MIRNHSIFAVAIVLGSCSLASAGTLVRNPTADAQADLFPLVFSHNGDVIVVENDSGDVDSSLGFLEFDIAELDPSQTVVSASLQLHVILWTGQAEPEARAAVYDGEDGDITDLDISPALNAPLSGLQTVDLGSIAIDLEPAHVQSVVDANSDYLGVGLFVTELDHNYGFSASENSFFAAPELTIEYVPEPATWVSWAVGLATLLLTARRRRRTGPQRE